MGWKEGRNSKVTQRVTGATWGEGSTRESEEGEETDDAAVLPRLVKGFAAVDSTFHYSPAARRGTARQAISATRRDATPHRCLALSATRTPGRDRGESVRSGASSGVGDWGNETL